MAEFLIMWGAAMDYYTLADRTANPFPCHAGVNYSYGFRGRNRLEIAMVSHFSADVVIHVVLPVMKGDN